MSHITLNETLKDLIERLLTIGKENADILVYLAQTAQPTLPQQYVVPLLQQMFCNLPNFLSKITPQQLTEIIKEPSAEFTTLRLLLDLRVVQQLLQQISQLQLIHLSNNNIPPGSTESKIQYLKKVQEVFQSWSQDTLKSYHKTMTETPLHLERQQLLQLEPNLSWEILLLVIELIKLPPDELVSFQLWFSVLPPAHLQILISLLAFESATLLAVKQKISYPSLISSFSSSSKKRKAETELHSPNIDSNNINNNINNNNINSNNNINNIINIDVDNSNINNINEVVTISDTSSPFSNALDEFDQLVSSGADNFDVNDFGEINFDLIDFSDATSSITSTTTTTTTTSLNTNNTTPYGISVPLNVSVSSQTPRNTSSMQLDSTIQTSKTVNPLDLNINKKVASSSRVNGSNNNNVSLTTSSLPSRPATKSSKTTNKSPNSTSSTTPSFTPSTNSSLPRSKSGQLPPPLLSSGTLISPIMSRGFTPSSSTAPSTPSTPSTPSIPNTPSTPSHFQNTTFPSLIKSEPNISTSPLTSLSSLSSSSSRHSLRILRQPPSQTVYQRILKPFPTVMLCSSYTATSDPESTNLFLEAEIIRSDLDQPIPSCLEGTRIVRISENLFASFKRLKIQSTSQQQGTLFRLKFTLKKYTGQSFENLFPSVSVISNLIEVFSHTQYLNERTLTVNLPIVTEVLPDKGSSNGGNRVVILGSGFVNGVGLMARFGEVIVPATWHEAGTLIVVTPKGKGKVLVTVTNDGVNYCHSKSYFTYE